MKIFQDIQSKRCTRTIIFLISVLITLALHVLGYGEKIPCMTRYLFPKYFLAEEALTKLNSPSKTVLPNDKGFEELKHILLTRLKEGSS